MRRKLTIMLVTAAVLVLIVATAASSMLPTYEDALDAELNNLRALSKEDFFETMKDKFQKSSDNEALIPLVVIFNERKGEYTPTELLKLIADNSLNISLRTTLVQVLSRFPDYDGSDERLSALLEKDIPNEIKQSIISHFGNKGGIESAQLAEMAQSEDENVAFHALKRLNQINPQKAYSISKNILQNHEIANNGQLEMAVKVFAYAKASSGSSLKAVESDNFLMYSVIDEILEGNYPPSTKDSVVFSLINTHSIEAMEYILDNSNIDKIMQKASVDRNYHTLIEMLENNPTAEQIEFAIECMELNPINEVAKPLEKAILAKPRLISANGAVTQSRVDAVLDLIENQGELANPAWNQ